MALYLVQHGHSLSKEVDFERGLSQQGFSEVQLIADMAKDHDISVSQIVHSGKKRASQSAHIFADVLQPQGGLARVDGLNPLDDVTTIADTLDVSKNSMLVGHVPFLEKLVSYLITGSTENRIVQFQNGGMVCLDQDAEGEARFIKWTLFPVIDGA
jgi:phosphohistidine phosphatase